jgi:3'-phosphoadenosine 5'-phosphosulfate sulfotransferase (PAPS reductase)/FAD synthetase
MTRLYISVRTRVVYDDVTLHPSKVRLLRRMLRDRVGRGRRPAETIALFASVQRGESRFIMPYKHLADFDIDTFIAYELGVYKKAFYEELKEIANNSNISSEFNKKQWLFLLFSPFPISDECCHIMKKTPCRDYEDETNRKPFIGQLAEESKKRKDAWYKTGCNAFYSERPQSNPMAFWTNQDVLEYIQTRNIKICSLYGNIVEDLSGTDEVEGQMTFSECGYENDHFDAEKPPLKLTGCDRTGCMFCGYGCYLEKEGEGRFKRMKETHPKQYEYIMKPTTQGGMDYKDVIDWLNEKGDLHIEY